jgi:Uma2 family endonuclease
MAVQGELQLQEERKDTLMNLLIIAKILSESTRNYDKGDKFAAYRTIPGFQEYVLIDQYTQHIEHYSKTEPRKWMFQEYDEADAVISFASVAFEISLADLYDKVEIEPAEVNVDG